MSATAREWEPYEVAEQLPAAIGADRLHLYYQPIVSLSDRSTTRLEALPRWQHPERGLVSPESFVAAAGQAGVLRELESWALAEALHQLSRWQGGVPGTLKISLNLSIGHATDPGLTDRVDRLAGEAGASAHRLGIELRAQDLRPASTATAAALQGLADRGVDLTLDGYAGEVDRRSLEEAPISTIKIGREAVAGVPDSPECVALVGEAIACGRDLGVAVIATGIENPGQASFLRDAGCSYGQGFLFSVAMPAEVLEGHIPTEGPE